MKESVLSYVLSWGIHILFALVIFFVGRIAVKLVVKILRGLLKRANLDDILVNFIASLCHVALLVFVIIAALHELGVDTTSLIAILGAAGLAVGLALKSSLQNFASGVLLILFRPFKKGDFVNAAGVSGTVQDVTIFNTVLVTPDNRQIVVPNGMIYNDSITNFSAKETRRIDMVFPLGYGGDFKKAREIAHDILDADERVLKDPAPMITLGELSENGVKLWVYPWVKSSDYWAVRGDLMEKIERAFKEAGLSIPYSGMRVYLEREGEGKR